MISDRKIALISDIIEQKLRKEKELEFYTKELEELQRKMYFLQKDVDLTNTIINLIQAEQIIDIEKYIDKSMDKLMVAGKK
jgi:hypothetical protein|tara:strand:+ start:1227 stop:1469 length:243 start_codon:yes stop_codon:yes gene_type:complete